MIYAFRVVSLTLFLAVSGFVIWYSGGVFR